MLKSRREVIKAITATGAIMILPLRANSATSIKDVFDTTDGELKIHPLDHASFIMEMPQGVVYVDPVGEKSIYENFAAPDLITITHEHPDHFDAELLKTISTPQTVIIVNPAVFDQLPDDIPNADIISLKNGEDTDFNGVKIVAIPAYNTTEDRLKFHPQGRDNGYIFNIANRRVYVSADTEDTPEMRALDNIDIAFLCMNLPFTMTAEQAASAVQEFQPKYVYPYHYRGRDGGTQDPEKFAELVGDASLVEIYDWYQERG